MTNDGPPTIPVVDELGRDECLGLLAELSVGRVGLVVGDHPEILPVNYVVDGETVLFRTAVGSPLEHAAGRLVAFEVDRIDEESRTGWSVLLHGVAEDIGDAIDGVSQRLRGRTLPTWAPGARERWFHVVPDSITGRRIRRTPEDL